MLTRLSVPLTMRRSMLTLCHSLALQFGKFGMLLGRKHLLNSMLGLDALDKALFDFSCLLIR